MNDMNCFGFSEKLVTLAREGRRSSDFASSETGPGVARGGSPERDLRAHLRVCPACAERFEAEQLLSGQLRAMSMSASELRSSAASRDALMRQFAEQHRPAPVHRWLWTLAAAAVLFLAFVLVRGPRKQELVALNEPPAEVAELSSDPQYEGFIPVPYVPPLAMGEMVRVVHTELYPAALASLGVSVDPAWNTQVPADLLMGQDGFPRAVRVSVEADDSVF